MEGTIMNDEKVVTAVAGTTGEHGLFYESRLLST